MYIQKNAFVFFLGHLGIKFVAAQMIGWDYLISNIYMFSIISELVLFSNLSFAYLHLQACKCIGKYGTLCHSKMLVNIKDF